MAALRRSVFVASRRDAVEAVVIGLFSDRESAAVAVFRKTFELASLDDYDPRKRFRRVLSTRWRTDASGDLVPEWVDAWAAGERRAPRFAIERWTADDPAPTSAWEFSFDAWMKRAIASGSVVDVGARLARWKEAVESSRCPPELASVLFDGATGGSEIALPRDRDAWIAKYGFSR